MNKDKLIAYMEDVIESHELFISENESSIEEKYAYEIEKSEGAIEALFQLKALIQGGVFNQ